MTGNSNKKESEINFEKISIHKNLLVLPSRVIQLSNISRVTSYTITKSWVFFMLLTITSFLYAVNNMNGKYTTNYDAVAVAVAVALFFYTIYRANYTRFGVQIQTSAVTTDFIVTDNQKLAEDLHRHIAYYINEYATHNAVINGITFVEEKGTVNIIQGDQILGDYFNEIKNSSIVNQSTIS